MDTNITERSPIAMDAVQSSQIAAIGHDPETNTLAIRFPPNRKGISSVYHYANFDAEQFAAFQAAESKGSHFGRLIKRCPDLFPYTNVTELYGEDGATRSEQRDDGHQDDIQAEG